MKNIEIIKSLVDLYGNPSSEEIFFLEVTGRGKGNKMQAINFLDKYFISEKEYVNEWKQIQEQIFNSQSQDLNNMVKFGYESFFSIGGTLFDEEDFNKIKSCLHSIGDKNLIVIENALNKSPNAPLFKLKFPSDIKWEEMNSGNFISVALLQMPKNEYFIFSESAYWGRYSPNEAASPMDITVFLPEYGNIFRRIFL